MGPPKIPILIITLIIYLKPTTTLVTDTELFPYSEADGNSRFMFGDDDFLEVQFTLPFHFFNKTYTSAFISGNGQISFGEGVRAYTPYCSPSSIPMIMGFWADADNRVDLSRAKLLYRETANRALLQKASKDIFSAFPQLQGITLSWMFIVTWKDIPFYGAKETCSGDRKRNTYQLALTSDGIHSFALLYYSKITWTTGSSSSGTCEGIGGNAAKAGFDYGDGLTLYTIPGSCTPDMLNVAQTSNINQPGKWVFRIDSNLESASCEEFDENRQKLRMQPPVVSIMGNTPLLVHGPCLENNANVTCIFRDLSRPLPFQTQGGVIPRTSVTVCPVPYLYSLGRIRVDLHVGYPNKIPTLYKGYVYTIKEQEYTSGPEVFVNKTRDGKLILSAKWDPTSLRMEEIEKLDRNNRAYIKDLRPEVSDKPFDIVDISLVEYDGKKWKEMGTIKSSITNNGFYQGPFNISVFKHLTYNSKKTPPRTFVVKGKLPLRSGITLEKQQAANIVDGTQTLGEELHGFFSSSKDKNISEKLGNRFDDLCKQWYIDEPSPPTDALPCPRTIDQAMIDSRFTIDKMQKLKRFHPGAVASYIQSIPSPSGAGAQCAYDESGRLLIGPPGGGRLHRKSPNSGSDHWGHYWDDVVPFLYCCKWSVFKKKNCRKYYYDKRPSNDGSGYAPPRPARAIGDPHITTFDGLSYTFNGIGEFWMVKYENLKENVNFKMQARMEQYVSVEGILSNASVFTAVAMQEMRNGSDVKIQVWYSSQRIFVMVDDEPVDVYESFDSDNHTKNTDEWHMENGLRLYEKGVMIFLKSDDEVELSFSTGFSFTFTTTGPNEVALNIIGSASANTKSQTNGLMGNFDDDISNDFSTPNGTRIPANASMIDIHYEFGMHWRVDMNDTIFSYAPGKSYVDYDQPDFRPMFLTQSDISALSENITEFCNGVMDCIFDYVTTGSDMVANATKSAYTHFEEVVQIVANEVKHCDPPGIPVNGYIVGSSFSVGSTIEVFCEEDYELYESGGKTETNYFCVDRNETDVITNHQQWVEVDSGKKMPLELVCLTDKELKEMLRLQFITSCLLVIIGALVIGGLVLGVAFLKQKQQQLNQLYK